MNKLLLCFSLALAAATVSRAQAVLNSFPPPPTIYLYYESVNAVAADAQGNAITAGKQVDEFASFTDTSYSLIQKYNAAGTKLWEGKIHTNGAALPNDGGAEGQDVATDPAGNSYLLGNYHNDTLQLVGSAPIIGPTARKIFVAKYNSAGAVQWVHSIDGNDNVFGLSLKTDAAGNVYITGRTIGTTVNLGNGVALTMAPPPANYSNSFIAKFSTSGAAVWAIPVWTSSLQIDVSTAGDVLLSTTPYADLSIGTTVYPNTQNRFLVARLNTAGVPQWVKFSDTPAGTGWGGLTVDGTGNSFVIGSFSGTLQLHGNTLTTPSGSPGTYFLAKYDPTGDLEWVKSIRDITSDSTAYILHLKADALGNCLLSGLVNVAHPESYDGMNNSDVYVAKVDDQGNLIWDIFGGSLTNDDMIGEIALTSTNEAYLVGGVMEYSVFLTPVPFSLGGHTTTVISTFENTKVFRMNVNATNRISGRVFYDFNANGVKDGADAYAAGQIVQTMPGSVYTSSSGANGLYKSYTEAGNYTVTLPNPLYYSAVPASHSLSFTGIGNLDTTRHFALQPMPNMQDLEVILTASTPPRPGFTYSIQLNYRNVGTTTLTGTLELSLDALLTYQNSTPTPTAQTGNTLTWTLTNLQPMYSGSVVVNTLVPATTPLGDTVNLTAQLLPISGDVTPANNTKTITALVVGAFDPNDKQVSQNWITPIEVADAKPLEYTIRFQNTGTDTAFTVRLLDTLDAQLNIPTFELLASSHTCTWSIRENGILEWRFDNILLPDSNTNEAASHGFVKYRIRPNTNLALGSIIRNTAGIYFDFNEPVITNTVTTEVALVSAVADVSKPQLHVYPNPNKGAFTVQLQNVQEQSVKAELRNVLGQTVWQQNLASENGNMQQQIKTSNLSKGIYYLQVSTGKGNAIQKVVIE